MRDYDPWVFTLLAEADHKEALREVARAQLARHAVPSRATPPSTVSTHRERRHARRLFGGVTAYARLLLRRRQGIPPWSSRVWPG